MREDQRLKLWRMYSSNIMIPVVRYPPLDPCCKLALIRNGELGLPASAGKFAQRSRSAGYSTQHYIMDPLHRCRIVMCINTDDIREMFIECKPSFSYHKLIHDRTSRLSQRPTDRRYVNLLLNPMCDCPSIYKHIYHSIQVSASNSSGVSSPSRILMIGVVTRTVVGSGALRCWSYR